jgi:hypothetical protein
MSTTKPTVPVGPTSVVGWSTAALAFVGALVAYFTGDHTAQSVTAVEAAGLGLVTLAITQLGRYSQVKKIETDLKPVLGAVKVYDPNFVNQLETAVKAEVAKLEAKLTGKAKEAETVTTTTVTTPATAVAPQTPVHDPNTDPLAPSQEA